MLETEWQTLVANINADVSGMLRAQQTLDEIHDGLRRREKNVVEEDFIFEDGWGVDTNAPRVRELYGVTIATSVLHRRGLALRDIKGADLLYEIAGSKFTLVQYKKPNRKGLVERDKRQLDDLAAACPNECPPYVSGYEMSCGAWYAVRPENRTNSFYLPACRADEIFGKADSRSTKRFGYGLSMTDFQQAFAVCLIGARVAPEAFIRGTVAREIAERNFVLFNVQQLSPSRADAP